MPLYRVSCNPNWNSAFARDDVFHAASFAGIERFIRCKFHDLFQKGLLTTAKQAWDGPVVKNAASIRTGVRIAESPPNEVYPGQIFRVMIEDLKVWDAELPSEQLEVEDVDLHPKAKAFLPTMLADRRGEAVERLAKYLELRTLNQADLLERGYGGLVEPEDQFRFLVSVATDLLFPSREATDSWRLEAASLVLDEIDPDPGLVAATRALQISISTAEAEAIQVMLKRDMDPKAK